jgi:hypothetical protein
MIAVAFALASDMIADAFAVAFARSCIPAVVLSTEAVLPDDAATFVLDGNVLYTNIILNISKVEIAILVNHGTFPSDT